MELETFFVCYISYFFYYLKPYIILPAWLFTRKIISSNEFRKSCTYNIQTRSKQRKSKSEKKDDFVSPFDLVKAASGGDDLNPKCKGAALASGDAIPGKKKTSFVVLYLVPGTK